jgi:hypothetical protein
VRILVINSKKGCPVPKQRVEIILLGGPGLSPGEPVKGSREGAMTDETGHAIFNVNPRHPFLSVSFQEMCASEDFPIETILNTGVIATNNCWHKSAKLKKLRSRPGELVVFFDTLNFFEQLRHLGDPPGIPLHAK